MARNGAIGSKMQKKQLRFRLHSIEMATRLRNEVVTYTENSLNSARLDKQSKSEQYRKKRSGEWRTKAKNFGSATKRSGRGCEHQTDFCKYYIEKCGFFNVFGTRTIDLAKRNR